MLVQWKGKGPRNVAIRRADGSTVVRPFRGLRDWQADLMLSLVNELFDHMAQNLPQNDEAPAPKGGQ